MDEKGDTYRSFRRDQMDKKWQYIIIFSPQVNGAGKIKLKSVQGTAATVNFQTMMPSQP